MEIYSITTGVLSVNTYFVVNKITRDAILIDGGQDYAAIKRKEKQLNVKIVAELLTHAHFDHSGNAHRLQKDGVIIYCSKPDAEKIENNQTLSQDFGREFDTFTCDKTLSDGDEIVIADIKIKVLLTAGHTDGSLCYIIGDTLFSGDTMFYESFGRFDFPTGNFDELVSSFKKLFSLKENYRVLSGHGEETTLEHERKYNPLAGMIYD
ncbi:MAG: MBL fold metallo-hydrolase [Clostridia bacterium]|nr:MBL fold metallo-hydrolase [Clostridia bacterium]